MIINVYMRQNVSTGTPSIDGLGELLEGIVH